MSAPLPPPLFPDAVSWRALEGRVPLDDLPAFHRAFLTWRGVEGADTLPLRRVQQRVEAELNKLVQQGLAKREEDEVQIERAALAGFETAQTWWP